MSLRLIAAPVVEPVSLNDAKTFLRVDVSDDDAYISNLIIAARIWVEKTIGRALITQTWEQVLDQWPGSVENGWWDGVRQKPISSGQRRAVELPRPPLQSVVSVKVYDDDNQASTLDAANYVVDAVREPGRVVLRSGQVWPFVGRAASGIEIRFIAGYGDLASDVPDDLKQALYLLIGHWFENREPVSTQSIPASYPYGVEALLSPYRLVML